MGPHDQRSGDVRGKAWGERRMEWDGLVSVVVYSTRQQQSLDQPAGR